MNTFNIFVGQYNNPSNYIPRKQSNSTSDANNSSEIDKARFESVLFRRGVPLQVIETLFKSMDVNGDGKVSKNDFQRVLQMYAQTTQKSDIPKVKDSASKVDKTTFSNISPLQKNQSPSSSQNKSNNEYPIGTLAKQATTYDRNGVIRNSTVSAFVNRVV